MPPKKTTVPAPANADPPPPEKVELPAGETPLPQVPPHRDNGPEDRLMRLAGLQAAPVLPSPAKVDSAPCSETSLATPAIPAGTAVDLRPLDAWVDAVLLAGQMGQRRLIGYFKKYQTMARSPRFQHYTLSQQSFIEKRQREIFQSREFLGCVIRWAMSTQRSAWTDHCLMRMAATKAGELALAELMGTASLTETA